MNIIIRGPLGCGKTTIAKELSRRLNAEYVSVDDVLEKNGLDEVLEDEGIPVEHFIKANEIIVASLRTDVTLSLSKGLVIIDGNFYYKEALEDLIERLPGETRVFTLKAPIDTCLERDRNRETSYGEDAVRAVHGMVSQFDAGEVIDVSGNMDESIEVLNKILLCKMI